MLPTNHTKVVRIQKIRIPDALIRKNQVNEITIKTGRNLMQTAYIDYDDIEFMNLFVEN